MLVLSRRKDESIIIDGRIVITVAEIRGSEVRLGIEAPRSVAVHRKEVFDAIQAENIAAGISSISRSSAASWIGAAPRTIPALPAAGTNRPIPSPSAAPGWKFPSGSRSTVRVSG